LEAPAIIDKNGHFYVIFDYCARPILRFHKESAASARVDPAFAFDLIQHPEVGREFPFHITNIDSLE
jgi:hypothetical protein